MNTSLSLSFELIYLIGWLLKNEKQMLNTLIKNAIKKGLGQDLNAINPQDHSKVNEQLYNTLIDFLNFMEDSLLNNMDELQVDTKTEKAMLAALRKVDLDALDVNAVRTSMQQTKEELSAKNVSTLDVASDIDQSTTLEQNESDDIEFDNNEKAATILLKNIIKNWKPSLNELIN
ncbi:hypothetical protein K2W90_05460 [Candidatus Babeliales bacterium]|nr:hypothetical protein [Candidatus Babeliales bacterium]